VKPKKEDKEMQTLDLASKVRWNDALNYNHRFMGVEFDFTDPQTAKQKASIDGLAAHIQKSLEEELFKRHLHLSR
jgi:hypothetical protein